MGGLAERDAVQGVGPLARRERPDHGVGQAPDDRVEGVSALDALGEGRRPGQQGGLASLACAPAGVKEGLPHA
jgi:hypothetical protein